MVLVYEVCTWPIIDENNFYIQQDLYLLLVILAKEQFHVALFAMHIQITAAMLVYFNAMGEKHFRRCFGEIQAASHPYSFNTYNCLSNAS